jgi:hypothetical protein
MKAPHNTQMQRTCQKCHAFCFGKEMKARGYDFVHGARLEPWGQTVARFISPEGLLVGLSYAPWMHKHEPVPAA